MNAAFYHSLDPRKRRALVGSFVLGALVMAFFAIVLAVLPPPPGPAHPEPARDASPSLVSSASMPRPSAQP